MSRSIAFEKLVRHPISFGEIECAVPNRCESASSSSAGTPAARAVAHLRGDASQARRVAVAARAGTRIEMLFSGNVPARPRSSPNATPNRADGSR
jgi:hypothetical protein